MLNRNRMSLVTLALGLALVPASQLAASTPAAKVKKPTAAKTDAAKTKSRAADPANKPPDADELVTKEDVDAVGAEPLLATIGLIDGESDVNATSVVIRFDHKPSWDAPSPLADHGTFLQLTLPGTIAPEPGKFYEGVGPYIKKIAVLQQTPTDAAIRLFVDKDAAKMRDATVLVLLDKRIVITLDHKKLQPSAESVVAATKVSTDSPRPSELIKAEGQAPTATAAGTSTVGNLGIPGVDMRDKLFKVTMFLGVMLAFLFASFMLRPYMRRRMTAKGSDVEAPISMRTIATLPLAARQKISLIQIGDEKILIGITPENVSFLTAIGGGGARQLSAAGMGGLQPQIKAGFGRMLGDEDTPTLSMQRSQTPPVLKDIPGNDEKSFREPLVRKSAEALVAQTKASTTRDAPARNASRVAPQADAPAPAPRRAAPGIGNRINVAVGDDGVRQLGPTAGRAPRSPAGANDSGEEGQKAIDDVTRMIREKLKNLRTL